MGPSLSRQGACPLMAARRASPNTHGPMRLGLALTSWLGAATVLGAVAAACTFTPAPPFAAPSMGIGGNPYNPSSSDPPEQIDNDAGQLVGYRPADAGYEAAPRSEGDASFPA